METFLTPAELLHHADSGLPWSADAATPGNATAAYRQALAVRALRIARGEQPRGFKIGFTNRSIWPRYNVSAPIWGTVYDSTVVHCAGAGAFALARTCQPRLEPECVFGIRATPPADSSLDILFNCIEWMAPGFELVQSHRPNWVFSAPDTVADGGLHAGLLVGPRIPVRSVANDGAALAQLLAESHVALQCDGSVRETGAGSAVLGSPLHALRHLVQALGDWPGGPMLQPGDVVTTGTWTDAWPVAPGESWRAAFTGPLGALTCTLQ